MCKYDFIEAMAKACGVSKDDIYSGNYVIPEGEYHSIYDRIYLPFADKYDSNYYYAADIKNADKAHWEGPEKFKSALDTVISLIRWE